MKKEELKEIRNKIMGLKNSNTEVFDRDDYPSFGYHDRDLSFLDKNPVIPSTSVYNMTKFINLLNGKSIALDCYDLSISYNEFIDLINIMAKSMKELGVRENDIITVATPNIIQGILVFYAANKIGATVTFLNSNANPKEINTFLNEYESKLYFNFGKDEETTKLETKDTKVLTTVTINKKDLERIAPVGENSISSDRIISFEDFLNYSSFYKNPFKTIYGGKQNSLILYTSGTTGKPKPVVFTNENIISSAMYMKGTTHVKFDNTEKSMCVVSFNYPYGFITSVIMSLMCQKETILTPGINLKNIYDYIMKYQPTIIQAIPSFYLSMPYEKRFEDTDLSFLKNAVSGGDFLSYEDNKRIVEFFRKHNSPAFISNGSGAAEVSGCATSSFNRTYNPYSVGRVLAGTKCKIIDPVTHEEKKYDEEGIICYAGKHIFKGYYNNEEETEKVKQKDDKGVTWYISDTYGKITKEGEIYILGRDKRFMITYADDGQPYKVYCDYVQTIISMLPFVKACAVVKMPDENKATVPKAYIVLKDEFKNVDHEEMLNKINELLPNLYDSDGFPLKSYEIPVDYSVIDELPLCESGKVDYVLLEKMCKDNYEKKLSLNNNKNY